MNNVQPELRKRRKRRTPAEMAAARRAEIAAIHFDMPDKMKLITVKRSTTVSETFVNEEFLEITIAALKAKFPGDVVEVRDVAQGKNA